MVVRIQIRLRPKLGRGLALTVSQWMTLLSVGASLFAFWRLGSDLNWTVHFAISGGLFSHWQVWLAMAVLLQIGASMLNRYGRSDGPAIP